MIASQLAPRYEALVRVSDPELADLRNIREWQHVVERAVILCDGESFSIDESRLDPHARSLPNSPVTLSSALLNQQREMIEAALEQTRGRISGPSGAAGKLGMARTTLESKIKSPRIEKYQFATA
jgi:formate hydrogenlyase transcriptional activator